MRLDCSVLAPLRVTAVVVAERGVALGAVVAVSAALNGQPSGRLVPPVAPPLAPMPIGQPTAMCCPTSGLDYDELRALDDPLEVSRKIVEAACGPRSESTIDHDEQRWVAAQIAEWVLEEQEADGLPQPDEIARKAIAFIMFEAIASEVGELINSGDRPEWTISLTDEELRDATEVLSQQAELSVDGVTNAEFAKAIEDGIETLREIYVVMD